MSLIIHNCHFHAYTEEIWTHFAKIICELFHKNASYFIAIPLTFKFLRNWPVNSRLYEGMNSFLYDNPRRIYPYLIVDDNQTPQGRVNRTSSISSTSCRYLSFQDVLDTTFQEVLFTRPCYLSIPPPWYLDGTMDTYDKLSSLNYWTKFFAAHR